MKGYNISSLNLISTCLEIQIFHNCGIFFAKPCKARSTLDKIQQKLKLFKQYFKGWRFNIQGELGKKKEGFKNESSDIEKIEEVFGLTGSQIERKAWLLCENFKLLEQQETY